MTKSDRPGSGNGSTPSSGPLAGNPTEQQDETGIIPLSRFRAALARARHRRRADLILEDPDAATLVPSLPVQELYYAIQELGLKDASELVALATPEQIQGFVDLDAWERDRMDVSKMQPWVEVLVDLGPEILARNVEGLDPEVWTLFIAENAHVYDLSCDDIPDEPEGHFYPTPDTYYLLDITAPDPFGKQVERFVDWLYRADQNLARSVVMSARWEMPSELHELAYRWRSGRMADLGYVDYYEALEIYRWLDPATVTVGENTAAKVAPSASDTATLPAGLTAVLPEKSFLARALATISDPEELERLWGALLLLVNRVMAADLVEPGDLEAAKAALERMAAYLGVGLEFLGRGDPIRAGEALRTVAAVRIFRVGVSLTVKLKRAAETLVERVWVGLRPGGRASLLDSPHAETVTALRRRRPLLARALVEGSGVTGERPFASLAEVALAARAVEEAALLATFFRAGFGVEPRLVDEESLTQCTPPRERIAFSTMVATMAANALLDRPPLLVPLLPADIPRLVSLGLEDNQLRPSARAKIHSAFARRFEEREQLPPGPYDGWLDGWLVRFEETLRLAADDAPAHRDGLIIRHPH